MPKPRLEGCMRPAQELAAREWFQNELAEKFCKNPANITSTFGEDLSCAWLSPKFPSDFTATH